MSGEAAAPLVDGRCARPLARRQRPAGNWGRSAEKWERPTRDRVRLAGMSFPITCTACQKTFTISDEIYEKKVAGRVVTIKCKSCAQGIRVDGTKGGTAAAPSPAATTPEPEPPAAPVGEPLWAVDYPDGQDREFTTPEVVTELERGTINGATLVWRDGMAEWLEISQVNELKAALDQVGRCCHARPAVTDCSKKKSRARSPALKIVSTLFPRKVGFDLD